MVYTLQSVVISDSFVLFYIWEMLKTSGTWKTM